MTDLTQLAFIGQSVDLAKKIGLTSSDDKHFAVRPN